MCPLRLALFFCHSAVDHAYRIRVLHQLFPEWTAFRKLLDASFLRITVYFTYLSLTVDLHKEKLSTICSIQLLASFMMSGDPLYRDGDRRSDLLRIAFGKSSGGST